MRFFQNVLTANFSFEYFTNMRESVLPVSLLSLFSLSAQASSYHSNVGVLQFVNPKIGTYGITPNGNGTQPHCPIPVEFKTFANSSTL
jgi:hypothetical protein